MGSDSSKQGSEQEDVKKQYSYWRIRIFYSMYIGYAFFYLTRKSFTFAMPYLMQDLHFDKSQLGMLATVLYITYGASKFISGMVSDRSNPRYFMSSGLILTGLFNIFFGLSSSLVLFGLFWGLNGWFQGWGWPPCAKLLTHWYAKKERGRWWGVWNTSHNVGGAVIPLIVAWLCASHGWRVAMYLPGVLCIFVGLFLMNRLRDTPEAMQLPSIEEFKGESLFGAKSDEESVNLSKKEILFKYVLRNRSIWLLAIAYFFVYIMRTAINDWGQLYLYEARGFSIMAASSCIFAFELGGFFGSLVSGFLSDKMFSGRRGPINSLFTLLSGVFIALLWYVPVMSYLVGLATFFSIGFFVFGPQMLIGMAAAEMSHKKAAGTATGFVGCFAYLGASCAGYPFGKISHLWGWQGFFAFILLAAFLAFVFLFPLLFRAESSYKEELAVQ
jgi:MFS transporter, OPA family, sugar phosphate sensor protein UhpC